MAHDPSAFIQEYFQIRADDTAGLNVDDFDWSENVDGSIATGVAFRIRFKVRETAAGADSTSFKIQVSRNSGTWIDLNIAPDTEDCPAGVVVLSSNYANGASTDELLTNTSTFVNGEGLESSITTSSFSLSSQETEFEYCLWIMGLHEDPADAPAQNVATDTLDFRMVESDGTVFTGTYTNPRITVSAETAGYIGGTYPEHAEHIGPFIDSNDNYYMVHEYSTVANDCFMFKSTDGGDTWRGMDNANRPSQGDLEGLAVRQDGDTLYILHTQGGAHFHIFRMSDHASADTWGTTDQVVDTGHTPGSGQHCALEWRSDGSAYAFYIDEGTPIRVVYKKRSTGGTWDVSRTELDSEASTDFVSVFTVLGENDTIHIFYKDKTNGILYHNTITSGDALQTRQAVETGMDTTLNGTNCPMIPPVYYMDNGTEVICIIYATTFGDIIRSRYLRDGVLNGEASVSTNDVERSGGSSQQVIGTAGVHNKEVFCFWSEDNVWDTWYDTNPDEAGWGGDTELADDVSNLYIRGRVIVNPDGDTVFGYLWDDGADGGSGFTYYEEFLIEAGGARRIFITHV